MKRGEEKQTVGRRYREITHQREEGRGKGSVNSAGAGFELTSASGAHGEALTGIPAALQIVCEREWFILYFYLTPGNGGTLLND